jgi:hypothetical protein
MAAGNAQQGAAAAAELDGQSRGLNSLVSELTETISG